MTRVDDFKYFACVSIAAILILLISAVGSAVTLELFILRPTVDGGSITTLLPGLVYGIALVLKVSIFEIGVLMLIAGGIWIRSRLSSLDNSSTNRFPVWSTLSILVPPLTPIVAALAVIVAQSLVDKPHGISAGYFPHISRIGVLVHLGVISAAGVASLIALVRGERPRGAAFVGFLTNAFLMTMFRYLEFYKLGFDQDRWSDV